MKRVTLWLFLTCCLSTLSACERLEGLENGGRYAAKSICSCIFVMSRDEESCKADLIGGAEQLPLSIDYDNSQVSAGLPFMQGSAKFVEGEGCQLD